MIRSLQSIWTTLLIVVLIIFFIGFLFYSVKKEDTSLTQRAIIEKKEQEREAALALEFNLSDPEQAPPGLKKLVMHGFNIMLDTPNVAKAYVGDRLSCTNCHFSAGNTLGGRAGGISLAGIVATYPLYNERFDEVIDLPTRINSCFSRSMNGRPLPLDSEEMLALITYLTWISKGFPIYDTVPWRGLKFCQQIEPNVENGKKLYATRCADCHGRNGEGGNDSKGDAGRAVPPLWGPHSFNDGAGMYMQSVLSSFIYNNMPYEELGLTEKEACDIAAFIRTQPRPTFRER